MSNLDNLASTIAENKGKKDILLIADTDTESKYLLIAKDGTIRSNDIPYMLYCYRYRFQIYISPFDFGLIAPISNELVFVNEEGYALKDMKKVPKDQLFSAVKDVRRLTVEDITTIKWEAWL